MKDLRDAGLSVDTINARLSGMTFAIVEASPAAQEGPGDTETRIAPSNDLATLLRPMQSQMESHAEQMRAIERRQRDSLTMFVAGVIVASVFFLIIVLLLRLGG